MPSGKEKPVEEDVKATAHTVEEQSITSRAGGYTAHTDEGQKIVVMKIPGEDINVLHTLIHEMSHAKLEHLCKKFPRGIAESEAKLSTYTVGSHLGFDFKEDPSVYMKGWLDNARSQGEDFGKENLDMVMNNARWLINEISGEL